MIGLWNLIAAPLNKIIDSVGSAIDKTVTSDEEKLILKNQLKEMLGDAELKSQQIELDYEKELTKRLAADIASDNWLSKSVRPLSLVFLIVTSALMALTDGNFLDFHVRDIYIEMYNSLLLVAFGFYFGGKSVERISSIVKGKRK